MSIDDDPAAALEHLKQIVRGVAPADKIDLHAMRLLGESEDVIDGEARDLFEELQHQSPPFSRSEAFGLALALREVVRERIREIEAAAT
jgi:hypothetical protein